MASKINFQFSISNFQFRCPADDYIKANSKKRIANSRILVAMSGGVDSSVVAAMLKKQGFQVIGGFLKFWTPPCDSGQARMTTKENICCNQEALRSARSVASKLKIPFYVFDVEKEFKREVVDYYINEYDSGRTPNPCVVCNKKIKFGWLLDKAKELGCDYIATGHYARMRSNVIPDRKPALSLSNGRSVSGQESTNDYCIDSVSGASNIDRLPVRNDNIIQLSKPKDAKKDQTYFLWQLSQKQLQHILFPLGDYTKTEVRKLAKKCLPAGKAGELPTAEKKESQNVCFVPDGDNADFLRTYVKKSIKAGNIVDKAGNILGHHEGLYKYTIGQRSGLPQLKIVNCKLKIKRNGIPPLYVVKLDIGKNELVVGVEKDLYSRELTAEKVNWVDSNFKSQIANLKSTSKILKSVRCQAKIRYGHSAERCKVYRFIGLKGRIKVVFNKPQRAITPGQSVVFYCSKNELLGGGIIK